MLNFIKSTGWDWKSYLISFKLFSGTRFFFTNVISFDFYTDVCTKSPKGICNKCNSAYVTFYLNSSFLSNACVKYSKISRNVVFKIFISNDHEHFKTYINKLTYIDLDQEISLIIRISFKINVCNNKMFGNVWRF